MRDFLTAVSQTPVPQPLEFLVDDVARTFGTVRVGHAEAFLRADDEAALAALVHDPRARTLGPAAARPDGRHLDRRRSTCCCRGCASWVPRRSSRPPTAPSGSAAPTSGAPAADAGRRPPGPCQARQAAQVQAVATAIRAGDRAESSRPPDRRARPRPSGALAALREAIEAGSTVVIGYVDNHGATGERVVDPRRLDGGRLSAFDHRADDVREFAVHRITGVRQA